MEIKAINVNEAFYLGVMFFKELEQDGKLKPTPSRNGPVLKWPTPVLTTYKMPMERCLINRKRNANHFFHFFESLWMLAGRNDVAYLTNFLPRIADYSDNGLIFNGAYGYRLKGWTLSDQIEKAITMLKADKETRRVVLQIWQPSDLGKRSKDLPCNTQLYLWIENGTLCMTICNRSNDMLWGAYGANAVHFSMIQEYIARCIGVGVGEMYQFSNNMHVYLSFGPWEKVAKDNNNYIDPYASGKVRPFAMDNACKDKHEFKRFFDNDLRLYFSKFNGSSLFRLTRNEFVTSYFKNVVVPMHNTWFVITSNKKPDKAKIMEEVQLIGATDWNMACAEWVEING